METEFPPGSIPVRRAERAEIQQVRERACRHGIPPSKYETLASEWAMRLDELEVAEKDPRWRGCAGDDPAHNAAMRGLRERALAAKRAVDRATAAPHVDLPPITPSAEQIAESQATARNRAPIFIGIFSTRVTAGGQVEHAVRRTEAGPRQLLAVGPLASAAPELKPTAAVKLRVCRLRFTPRGARTSRFGHRAARRVPASSGGAGGTDGEQGPEPPAPPAGEDPGDEYCRAVRSHFDRAATLITQRRFDAASRHLRLVLSLLANVADQDPSEVRGSVWAARAHATALVALIDECEFDSLRSHIRQAAAYFAEAGIESAARVRP